MARMTSGDRCPACRLTRLLEPYAVCPVCAWEWDGEDETSESLVNGEISAVQYRETEEYARARAWFLVVHAGAALDNEGEQITLEQWLGVGVELIKGEDHE